MEEGSPSGAPHQLQKEQSADAAEGEWYRFTVPLEEGSANLISWRALVKAEKKKRGGDAGKKKSGASDPSSLSSPSSPQFPLPSSSKKQKRAYDFIELLELKYGGGYIPNNAGSDTEVGNGAFAGGYEPVDPSKKGSKKRRKNKNGGKTNLNRVFDDEPDTDDEGFIDDTELIAQQDSLKESEKWVTKHDGFFVNAGSLETTDAPQKWRKTNKRSSELEEEDDDHLELVTAPGLSRESSDGTGTRGGGKRGSTTVDLTLGMGKLKGPWEPTPAASEALKSFETAVSSYSEKKSLGKLLPKVLENELSEMDGTILRECPQAHLARGYFESLMHILPYSYRSIERTLLRVGSRRSAKSAKEAHETEYLALKTLVAKKVAEQMPALQEARKTGKKEEWSFSWDPKLRQALEATVSSLSDWLALENAAREKMLANEKRAVGSDASGELHERKEKTQLLESISSLWPKGMNVDVKEIKKYYALERRNKVRSKRKSIIGASGENSDKHCEEHLPVPSSGSSGEAKTRQGKGIKNDVNLVEEAVHPEGQQQEQQQRQRQAKKINGGQKGSKLKAAYERRNSHRKKKEAPAAAPVSSAPRRREKGSMFMAEPEFCQGDFLVA